MSKGQEKWYDADGNYQLSPAEQEVVDAIIPLTYTVLVRPLPVETGSDLVLPDSVIKKEEMLEMVGRVLALGPLCFNHPKFDGTQPFKVGDYVLFGQYAGKKIRLADDRMIVVLFDDQIICAVKNPAALDRGLSTKRKKA